MNSRPMVVAGAVLVLVAAFLVKEGRRSDPRAGSADLAMPQEVTALPRLVDLGADRCIPCKKMAPILEELSRTYRDVFAVEFIDVWKNPGAAREWGIRVIPTQVFIDAAGVERFRHQGFLPRETILAKWMELGVEVPLRSSPEGS
jgi:thioredoxin 1